MIQEALEYLRTKFRETMEVMELDIGDKSKIAYSFNGQVLVYDRVPSKVKRDFDTAADFAKAVEQFSTPTEPFKNNSVTVFVNKLGAALAVIGGGFEERTLSLELRDSNFPFFGSEYGLVLKHGAEQRFFYDCALRGISFPEDFMAVASSLTYSRTEDQSALQTQNSSAMGQRLQEAVKKDGKDADIAKKVEGRILTSAGEFKVEFMIFTNVSNRQLELNISRPAAEKYRRAVFDAWYQIVQKAVSEKIPVYCGNQLEQPQE